MVERTRQDKLYLAWREEIGRPLEPWRIDPPGRWARSNEPPHEFDDPLRPTAPAPLTECLMPQWALWDVIGVRAKFTADGWARDVVEVELAPGQRHRIFLLLTPPRYLSQYCRVEQDRAGRWYALRRKVRHYLAPHCVRYWHNGELVRLCYAFLD